MLWPRTVDAHHTLVSLSPERPRERPSSHALTRARTIDLCAVHGYGSLLSSFITDLPHYNKENYSLIGS